MAYSEEDLCAFRAEISSLEEEIHNLEDLVRQRQVHQVSTVSWPALTSIRKQKKSDSSDPLQNRENIVAEVKNELLLLKYFTGIELNNVIAEVSDEKDDDKKDSSKKTYTAHGSSNGFLFQLEFTVHKSTFNDESTLVVSNLQIDSMDHINQEHNDALTHLESQNTCDGFASVFSTLTKQTSERVKAFTCLYRKYKDIVSLPETATGTLLIVSHPSLAEGVSFEVCWEIRMSQSLQVHSSIELRGLNTNNSVPDDVDTVRRASNKFKQLLLDVHPMEAIDTIISDLYT